MLLRPIEMSLPVIQYREGFVGVLAPSINAALRLSIAAVITYWGTDSSLFVRHDVALVYVLASLPLAVTLRRSLTPYGALGTGAVLAMALATGVLGLGYWWVVVDCVPVEVMRIVISFGVTTTAWLCLPAFIVNTLLPSSWIRGAVVSAVFGLLVSTCVPLVYVAARCRHDEILIEELVSQSRFGEADSRIREIRQLAPSMVARSGLLKQRSNEIANTVAELESEVANASQTKMTSENRLEHCRRLAMLGRNDQALVELAPLLAATTNAPAWDLAGTIHETNGEWNQAKASHERAIRAWQSQTASSLRDAGLVRSALRLAHCERKLGNYNVAESHYLEVLAALPTAENHFLLAQFYEDMQHSNKAYAHARQAMTLDSRRYQESGKKLIDKLQRGHFGCFQVYQQEANGMPHTGSFGFAEDLTRPLSK